MTNLNPIINALLSDSEFMAGGIFAKEAYYERKYDLTHREMLNIECRLYWALNPDKEVKEYNVNNEGEYDSYNVFGTDDCLNDEYIGSFDSLNEAEACARYNVKFGGAWCESARVELDATDEVISVF